MRIAPAGERNDEGADLWLPIIVAIGTLGAPMDTRVEWQGAGFAGWHTLQRPGGGPPGCPLQGRRSRQGKMLTDAAEHRSIMLKEW
jgi:hypothetical protein